MASVAAAEELFLIADIHQFLAYVVVGSCGAMGLAGVGLAIAKRPAPRWFDAGKYVPLAVSLVQVSLGLVMFGRNNDPGGIHVFYGVVTVFTLAFAYIYRATLSRRPTLGWGLLLLFVMGLGIRGWMNFGETF